MNEKDILIRYIGFVIKDGWIVTNGFKTGVVKLVGEAIYDYKVINPRSRITAIGCSKWGAVKGRQSLILVNI